MLQSEGYKMFYGVMRIIPKTDKFKPFEVEACWLYKPEYDCWYGRGSSYCADICEVKEDYSPANKSRGEVNV